MTTGTKTRNLLTTDVYGKTTGWYATKTWNGTDWPSSPPPPRVRQILSDPTFEPIYAYKKDVYMIIYPDNFVLPKRIRDRYYRDFKYYRKIYRVTLKIKKSRNDPILLKLWYKLQDLQQLLLLPEWEMP